MRSWFALISIFASVSAALAQPAPAAKPSVVELQSIRKALITRPVEAVKPEAVKPEAVKPLPPSALTVSPVAIRPGILYKVPVAREEEQKINQAVAERVKAGTTPSTQVVPLPGVVRQAAKDGSEIHLKPFVLPGQPLTYQARSRQFEGSIRVGVADIFDHAEGKPLSAPMTFQVLESQMADPESVALEATSPPHKTIVVRSDSPGASVTVHVVTRFDPAGTAVTLPVHPTLVVRLERAEIQGYGLETTVVHIESVGLEKPAGRRVQLGAKPSAFFEPAAAELSQDGTARVVLRSDSPGPVTITASAPGLAEGSATVLFLWPARTLAFALIGGLMGGLLRYLPRRRRSSARQFALGLFVAVLTGLVVFLLYAVGVKVLPFEPTVSVGAVLVLAVAAFGAWAGTGLLAKLGRA